MIKQQLFTVLINSKKITFFTYFQNCNQYVYTTGIIMSILFSSKYGLYDDYNPIRQPLHTPSDKDILNKEYILNGLSILQLFLIQASKPTSIKIQTLLYSLT